MTAVLGVHDGHLATATLVLDGKIVACASEERFTRVKNQSGFPAKAIDFVLKQGKLAPQDLDLTVLAGFHLAPISATAFQENDYLTWIYKTVAPLRRGWGSIEYHLPFLHKLGSLGYSIYSVPGFRMTRHQRLKRLRNYLGLDLSRVEILEHHYCHAYSAMCGPNWGNREYLVLTLDGEGDEICATVNLAQDGKLRRLIATPKDSSLGWIYAEVTRYLGMKPLEHEYKVMGLAPYAQPDGVERTYKIMRRMISMSRSNPLVFKASLRTNLSYRFFAHYLAGHRFDWIAGAAQKLTEELILSWISAAIKETGVHTVSLCGGVFMNVKANLRVLELEDVEELFVFPSCGDESNSIGAALWGYSKVTNGQTPEPLKDLYLGPSFEDPTIEPFLNQQKLQYEKYDDIERAVAELVSKHKVVARMKGPMEWGARALGNRSILADPSDWETVRVINNMIKQRDFWMPFAPSLLDNQADEYIENPKRMPAPYMIMAFHSTLMSQRQLKAAMHPYDFTLRPQVVTKEWNPSYYTLIEEFKRITGIGGILNTSFNLHGEPVVCTPSDAIHVLSSSGLEYLAMGNYLISRRAVAS